MTNALLALFAQPIAQCWDDLDRVLRKSRMVRARTGIRIGFEPVPDPNPFPLLTFGIQRRSRA